MLAWNSEKLNDIICVLICCIIGKQQLAICRVFKIEGNTNAVGSFYMFRSSVGYAVVLNVQD